MSKFHSKPTTLDGYRFDSMAEARRYGELKLLLMADVINHLEIHPEFMITVSPRDGKPDVLIGEYHADFQYWDNEKRKFIIEDVKGGNATKTEAYKLRKKLVEAIYGVEIMEVQA